MHGISFPFLALVGFAPAVTSVSLTRRAKRFVPAVVAAPEDAFQSNYNRTGAPTCAQEDALKMLIADEIRRDRDCAGDANCKMGPEIIRAVFHDAVDRNNLLISVDGSWVRYAKEGDDGADYGGIDGCLYSPLDGPDGTSGSPSPGHNRNIPKSFNWAQNICENLCKVVPPAGMRGTPLCKSINDCMVDLRVLGSIHAIESNADPDNTAGLDLKMSWGRSSSNCEEFGIKGGEIALQTVPALHGMDTPELFHSFFRDQLGMTDFEQAALMGAHSFGQVQECASALNGIEKGNFCSDHMRNDDMTIENHSSLRGSKKNIEFGDGGVFDKTPEVFDNNYFQLFDSENFSQKDTCCGKLKHGECHRGNGGPVRITERDPETGLATQSEELDICDMSWCRSDRKGRSHMKSSKAWTRVRDGFMKKKHGLNKRMIRLAADWALLEEDGTRVAVQRFAKDQSAFFESFSSAWGKVIAMSNGDLQACVASSTGDGAPSHNDMVDFFYKRMGCMDKSPSWCTNRRGKCGNKKVAKRCPRTCGHCPDQ